MDIIVGSTNLFLQFDEHLQFSPQIMCVCLHLHVFDEQSDLTQLQLKK